MTAAGFQGAIAALVTDRSGRAQAGLGVTPSGLSAHKGAQITRLADDPGLIVTAKLIASFRLGKLLALLPLTRELLGNEALATEVELFWSATPPTSFYLPDEALAFCDHLDERIAAGAIDVAHLSRMIALERAEIVAGRPRVAFD